MTIEEHIKMTKDTKSLEGKARFLEETLERMQSHSDYLHRSIRRSKNPQTTKDLKKKALSVNEGLREVRKKAHILWQEIATIEKELKANATN
jgi:hypothetical protein